MTKVFYLFIIFYYYRWVAKTTLKVPCMENGVVYNIGDNFSKSENDCIICTCSSYGEDLCHNIYHCEELNCHTNYYYKCCKKLKCLGIFYLKR